jgi:16S rRNA (cytosine967-C5)-methyltransferase
VRLGGRIAAAIEILADMEARKRPAAEAVKDWMLAHRFAGSHDRSAIGDLVFCALRKRASSSWRLGGETPRNWTLGALRWSLGLEFDALAAAWAEPHAPEALTDAELQALARDGLGEAPPWVAGDYPEWLDANLDKAFGAARAAEGEALAAMAPVDLRANTLLVSRDKLLAELADHPRLDSPPELAPFAPNGLRLPWRFGRAFGWSADPAFRKGWFEVQDEASQLVAELAAARPGLQVADVCAGGGGKTLALAATMDNKGQIYAFDVDERRLGPVRERAERAGVRNLQIRAPRRSGDPLADLAGRMDLVLVDAPCTGSGTWRRAPDTKWRVRPNALATRQAEQQAALARAAPLVKPGGRLVYVTCSVLPEENTEAVARFLAERPDFAPLALTAEGGVRQALVAAGWEEGAARVQFTPLRTGTDGFFVAMLARA